MRECATQANASHWISPNRREIHAVFHRCRYVYTVQIFYWASSTIEQLKDAIRQEIEAVNIDTLGKVFQNLEKRIQVWLDVKGAQFQNRL